MFSYLRHNGTTLKIDFDKLDGVHDVFFSGVEKAFEVLIIFEAVLDSTNST